MKIKTAKQSKNLFGKRKALPLPIRINANRDQSNDHVMWDENLKYKWVKKNHVNDTRYLILGGLTPSAFTPT